MNERLVPWSFTAGETDETLGNNFLYIYTPVDLEIVGVDAAPSVDDSDLTLDINDDGSAAISAVSCADQDVPGTWRSTHMGGSETPVHVDADSKLSFDANGAAANTRLHFTLWVLVGEAMA